IETRFICRFQPYGVETLSYHEVNYDYHTWRKRYSSTFTYEGFDNHMIWTSQLIFHCPVPTELQTLVASGMSVRNDYATLYLDIIPIRTPPRYGSPTVFLPPRFEMTHRATFDPIKEWGENHVLPDIESSGRWENLPICKPPLMQKYHKVHEGNDSSISVNEVVSKQSIEAWNAENDERRGSKKPHKLVACTWASTTFKTRGNRAGIGDGSQRLKEWIAFHLLAGFDHVYVYDNYGAFHEGTGSLKPVTDLFSSSKVTHIDWPAAICNNNPNNVNNKGERSSQYAAESSCRMRFGPHTDWMAFFDTDEYLIPMGQHTSFRSVLDELDEKGIRIFDFRSQRAKPRFSLLEYVNVNCGEFSDDSAQKV
ncbi:MAG: glycosyltransferase family 92 protein, partial [Gaiellaceae bacterium]